jgi:hemerythrin-like domain-containing protein
MANNVVKGSILKAAVPLQADLAQVFAYHLKAQEAICDNLEAIADSLPASVNHQMCIQVTQELAPLISQAHRFEENQLFPLLMNVRDPHLDVAQTIKRLQAEHLSDEDYAEELCGAISSFRADADHSKGENLGWMLRGFFESIRRHIAFEREYILPLVNKL